MAGLEIRPGIGPLLALRAADGAEALVTAHGAHVIGWKTPDGIERLFLSERAAFGGNAAIRGGVPVIFPQFAGEGPLPKHGFARNRPWRLIGSGTPASGPATAIFALDDDVATRAIWLHAFHAELTLQLHGPRLAVGLAVTNTGDAPIRFTAALHSYLRVDDIADARIGGLGGLRYRDSAAGGRTATEAAGSLAIAGEVDRIYFDAPAALELVEPRRRLRIESRGLADAVVWNPGEAKAAELADLHAGGWRQFVCVEAAVVGRPVELMPGAQWQGQQTLVGA